ncbi:MAG: leucine-rich repeat protein, partial [Acholeplasmatales bacterium]|nr:leucine-rich repeat protein [Acholeplasmatales bacterium]
KSLKTVNVTVDDIISDYAFNNTLVDSVVLTQVKVIGDSVFEDATELDSFIIPAVTDSIGQKAFKNATSLQNVTFAGLAVEAILDETFYGTINLQNINSVANEFNLPEGIKSIGASAFEGSTTSAENDITLNIPASIKAMGDKAFKNTSMIKTPNFLGENISVISKSLFENSGITSLVLPDSITTINDYAFKNTHIVSTNENPLEISSLVNAIGDRVFADISELTTVVINNIDTGTYTFENDSNLRTVIFTNNSLTTIKEGLFKNASSLDVPSDSLMILPSVKKVEAYAFYNTNLTTIDLQSVEEIGSYAFAYNAFTNVVVPDTVESIGYAAFSGCGLITKMTLPFIGESYGATGSRSLFGYIFGREQYNQVTESYDNPAQQIVQFMKDDVEGVYQNVPFLNELGQEVTEERFYIPANLHTLTISNVVTRKITNGQLSGVTTLNYVNLPFNLTEIEQAAFSGNTNMIYIEISKRTTTIGKAAFENMYPNFFITAYYEAGKEDSPEGWVGEYNTIDDPIETQGRWHTVYPVYCDGADNIYKFEYDSVGRKFTIVGFTSDLNSYLYAHKGILFIPSTKATRPVSNIAASAFVDYECNPAYNGLDAICGVDLPTTMESIGSVGNNIELAFDGHENFVVYFRDPKSMIAEKPYMAVEAIEKWLGDGIAYYGFDDEWTLSSGRVYQELLSKTKISLNLDNLDPEFEWDSNNHYKYVDLDYSLEDGYFLEYQGINLTPQPLIESIATKIGSGIIPSHPFTNGDYRVEFRNNLNVSYDTSGNVISDAWARVYTNNSNVFATQKSTGEEDYIEINFRIDKAQITVTVSDEQRFAEDTKWTNDNWEGKVEGLKFAEEEIFEGLLATKHLAPENEFFDSTGSKVKYDNDGNIIPYESSSLVHSYTAIANGDFDWLTPWTIKRNDVDITSNYDIILDASVTILPQKVNVQWRSTRTEFDATLPLPIVDAEIPVYNDQLLTRLPLTVTIYDRETGEAIYSYISDGTQQYTNSISDISRYNIIVTTTNGNYYLTNSSTFYVVTKETLTLPSVLGYYEYTGEAQQINVTEYSTTFDGDNSIRLFEYYQDEECKIKYENLEDIVFTNVGTYNIYARLTKPNNYQWLDYRDPLFRSDTVKLSFTIIKKEIKITLGNKTHVYDNGNPIVYEITPDMVSGNVTILGKLSVPALVDTTYGSSYISIIGLDNNAPTINGEEITGDTSTGYSSANYTFVIDGSVRITYESSLLSVKLDNTIDVIDHTSELNPDLRQIYDYYGKINVPYDTLAHRLVVTGSNGSLVSYGIMDNDEINYYSGSTYESFKSRFEFIDHDTYRVYFRIEAPYRADVQGMVDITIDKIYSNINVVDYGDLVWDADLATYVKTYDGNPINITYEHTGSTGSIDHIYYDSKDFYYRSNEQILNADSWRMIITYQGDNNYLDTIKTINFTINKYSYDVSIDSSNYLTAGYLGTIVTDETNVRYESSINLPFANDVLTIQYYISVDGDAKHTSASTLDDLSTYYYLNETDLSTRRIHLTGNYVRRAINNTTILSVSDNYDITIRDLVIYIEKREAEIRIVGSLDREYSGLQYGVPTIITNTTNGVVVKYYSDSECQNEILAPTNVGNYFIKIVANGDTNTFQGELIKEFRISELRITPVMTSQNEFDYTGSIIKPEFSVTALVDVTFITTLVDGDNGTLPGTHAVIVSVLDNDTEDDFNYANNFILTKTRFEYTIKHKVLNINIDETIIYNENSIWTKNFNDLSLPISIIEALNQDAAISLTRNVADDYYLIGEYNFTENTLSDNPDFIFNNLDILDANQNSTIANYIFNFNIHVKIQYPTIVHTVEDATLENGVWKLKYDYDGQTHSAIVTVDPSITGYTIVYTYNQLSRYTPYSRKVVGFTSIAYKITAKNYIPVAGVIEFEIASVDLKLNAVDPTKKFDKKALGISSLQYTITPAIDVPVTVQLFNEKGNQISYATTVGSYYYAVKVDSTINYTGFEERVDFEILKADMNLRVSDTYKSIVFENKEIKDIPVYSELYNPTLTYVYYELSGDEYVVMTEGKPKDVGSYKVLITSAEEFNYHVSKLEFEFVIEDYPLKVVWGNLHYVYNGEVRIPTATATTLDGQLVDNLSVKIISGDCLRAGEHIVKATLGEGFENYDLENSEATVVIDGLDITASYYSDYVEQTGELIRIELDENNVSTFFAAHPDHKLELVLETKTIALGVHESFNIISYKVTKEVTSGNPIDVTDTFNLSLNVSINVREKLIDYKFENQDAILRDTVTYVYALDENRNAVEYCPTIVSMTQGAKLSFFNEEIGPEGDWEEVAPKYSQAGTYSIRFKLELDEHETYESTMTFIISKADYEFAFADGYSLNKIYDGNKVVPQAVINNYDEYINIYYYFYKLENEAYVAAMDNAAIDAGSYRVDVLIIETLNYNVYRNSYEFTISKATASATVENDSLTKTYDGKPLDPRLGQTTFYNEFNEKVSGYDVIGNGEFGFNYYIKNADDSFTKLDYAPINAGTYYVTVTMGMTGNYNEYESEKYEARIIPTTIYIGRIYDENESSTKFSYGFNDGEPFSYNAALLDSLTIVDGEYEVIDPYYTFTGLIKSHSGLRGIYNSTADFYFDGNVYYNNKLVDRKNYEVVVLIYLEITEAQAIVTVTNYVGDYDGNYHTIGIHVDESTKGSWVVSYAEATADGNIKEGISLSKGVISYVDYGTYYIYYQIAFENYATISGVKTVTINQIETIVTSIEDVTREYNGFEIKDPTVRTNSTGAITYTYYDVNHVECVSKPKDAGIYYVVISIAESDNHNYSSYVSEAIQFEIESMTVRLNWKDTSLYYTGSVIHPYALILTNTYDHLVLDYTYPDSIAVSLENESYQITAQIGNYIDNQFVADKNYRIANPTQDYVINLAVIDRVEGTTRPYNGNAYDPFISPNVSYVIYDEFDNFAVEIKDHGTYRIVYTLHENYIWDNDSLEPLTVIVTITQGNLGDDLVDYDSLGDQNFTGYEVKPQPVVRYNGYLLVLDKDYELSYVDNINAYNETTNPDGASVIVTGINNFYGSIEIRFNIISMVFSLINPEGYKFVRCDSSTRFTEFTPAQHTSFNKYYKTFLAGVSSRTTVAELIEQFKENQRDYIVVFDNKGRLVTDYSTYVGTGFNLKLSGTDKKLLDDIYISIKGDLDGNGVVNANDQLLLTRHTRGQALLKEEFFYSADINGDGLVNANDLTLIKRLM